MEEVYDGNRPARKVYRITDKGCALFDRLLRKMWTERRQTLYPLDIAMFFIDSLPKEEVWSVYFAADRWIGDVVGASCGA